MVQFENWRTLQIHFSRAFPEEKPLAVQPMSLQIESIEFQWVLMESLE